MMTWAPVILASRYDAAMNSQRDGGLQLYDLAYRHPFHFRAGSPAAL